MAVHYAPGTYPAKITGQDIIETEYGFQLAIRIMPQDGEYERTVFLGLTNADGSPASFEWEGETINVADQTLDVVAYLGLPDGHISKLSPTHPEHFSLIGLQVEAYCSHKAKQDGSQVERWRINTPRALPGKPAETNSLKKLDSLFGKALKAKQKERGGEPPAAAETPPVDLKAETDKAVSKTGDDIPF